MSGLLRRLTRRPATADENRSPTASSDPAATPATAGGERPLPAGDDQPTQVIAGTSEPVTREWAIGPTGWSGRKATEATAAQRDPGAAPATTAAAPGATVPTAGQYPERRPDETHPERSRAHDLPAGVDPAELEHAPASARRGKLRRRLRYLRSVRELLLRDLGGVTYEIHRTGSGAREESHARLQQGKAERLAALDAEVGALETRLGEPHAGTTLREAGIGGTCPVCGELHASDAHFCSRCGTPLDAKARAKRDAAGGAPAEESRAGALWAGLRGRKPAQPAPPESPDRVTGEWLGTGDQPTTFDRPDQPGTGTSVRDEKAAAAAGDENAAASGQNAAAGSENAAVAGEPVAPSDEPSADGERRAAGGDRGVREGEAVTFVEGRREQP